jgi:hypothetical protein
MNFIMSNASKETLLSTDMEWRKAVAMKNVFSEDGLTLAQALERLPGIDEMDLAAQGAMVARSGTA